MSSADSRTASRAILCAGIIVLDEVFLVEDFPQPDGKTTRTQLFRRQRRLCGQCRRGDRAARRLGRARAVRSAGRPARTPTATGYWRGLRGSTSIAAPACGSRRCATPLSAIFIDARGDRMIMTYRDDRIAAATPPEPTGLVATADAVLADNRFPDFVRPICTAARERGLTVVLDADKPTDLSDPLLRIATHVIFSANGCARPPRPTISPPVCFASAKRRTPSSPSPTARRTCSGATARRCAAARPSRSRRWIRSAPATFSMALSRWRSPKVAMLRPPCVSASAAAALKCARRRRFGRRPDSRRGRGFPGRTNARGRLKP